MSSVVSFSFSRTRHLYGLIMITIKFLGKKGKPIGGKTRGGFCFFVYLFIFVFLLQVFLFRTNQKLNKKYITL